MTLSTKEVKERHFEKKREESAEIECACGCGVKLKEVDMYGRAVTHITGHNRRVYTGEDAGRKAAGIRYRKANPEKIRDNKRNYYRSKKLRAMRLLGNKCKHCEQEYDGTNAPIFEFHHVEPEFKENGVTRMLTNKAWEFTKLEMEKCILICANCHNQHHGGKW